jgi:hypothetical protein
VPRHTRDLEAACRRVRDQRYDDLTIAELITLQRVGNPWAFGPPTWAQLARARDIITRWDAQPLPAPEPTKASQ